jgi:cyclopropane fatty-acyl-phospholipid synthase-like methyltransferase
VNERVVEVPFVWRNLDLPLGAKVLDFGCNESLLPVQLASLGYDVSGVDLLHYAYRHPAFRFQQRNLVGAFQSEAFDGITSVSVVEHIGLGGYGEEVVARTTDVEVMEELYRILKTNGLLILTIPFGRKFTGSQYRVYDQKGVEELLSKFAVENVEFYRRSDKLYWMPCDHDEMKDLPSGEEPDNASRSVNGVMCIKARKR